MFIYEKDGKLNIAFQNTQIPPETPDYVVELNKLTVGNSTFPTQENNQEIGDLNIVPNLEIDNP